MIPSSSSFTPIDPAPAAPRNRFRDSLVGALDGSAFSLPAGLGAVAMVFSHVGLEYLPAGVVAFLLATAWLHLTTAHTRRPLVFTARFFEAATMAALLDQLVLRLPSWGMADTPAVRLAVLCLVGTCAGLTVGLLYLARADRLTRFIPAPVFAGFSNSIAVALVVSQSGILWSLATSPGGAGPVVTIAAIVLCTGLGLRRYRPRLPATAIALAVGLLAGLVWMAAGRTTPAIGAFGWSVAPPIALADFRAFAAPGVHAWQAAGAIVSSGLVLGATMFLNTSMAAQFMTRRDGRRNARPRDAMLMVAGMALAGLAGSAPLSGSMNASTIAARTTALTPLVVVACALVAALVFLTGVAGLVPLAAVCAALLFEAWLLLDRPSLRLLADWLRRRAMPANGRDDLIVVAGVMAAGVMLNMVAALFVGLLFGLVLFAVRNARQPVRQAWTGLQVASNCARSRHDLALLADHGAAIRVLELEGDLFFGAIDSLERSLHEAASALGCIVIDWSRVRHLDTSVALAMAQFDRHVRAQGIFILHAGADGRSGHVAAVLSHHMPQGHFSDDLDRALERAENHLLQAHAGDEAAQRTVLHEAAALLQGLDDAEYAFLAASMVHRLFHAGEVMLAAGEVGDELMLVLHGTASVVVDGPGGKRTRLAGARRGAMLGEIAFLDKARRSATVIADEDTNVAILRRDAFDALSASHPQLVQRLLANIAAGLGARLRHANRLSLLRHGAPAPT